MNRPFRRLFHCASVSSVVAGLLSCHGSEGSPSGPPTTGGTPASINGGRGGSSTAQGDGGLLSGGTSGSGQGNAGRGGSGPGGAGKGGDAGSLGQGGAITIGTGGRTSTGTGGTKPTTGGRAGGGGSGGGTAGSNLGGSNAGGSNTGGNHTGGSHTGGRDASGGSGSDALVNPAPGSKAFVGVNFWRIDWEGAADFFVPNLDWATVKDPWQPQLISDLAPFTVLRFMDWNLTNDDPNPQATWTTRKLPTQSQGAEPIAFEWQIDLCNRTLKDCWITVPIQANASFQESLARLAHDRLDPRLRLYVEYSNEVWNGGFVQAKLALTQANQLNLPVSPNSCCETDTIKTGNAYVYGAVRMFERFESVFGQNSPRLIKVLSGQSGWDGPCQVHMEALKNATLNPNGTMPTAYAIAPYFGGTSISALQTEITDAANGVKAHIACAAKQGLPVIGYEGGSDSYSAGKGCVTLQHDAGMYDLYKQYFDALTAAGMKGPIMQYTEVGSCWGLKEKTSDTLANSPKYRAVADWIAAHP